MAFKVRNSLRPAFEKVSAAYGAVARRLYPHVVLPPIRVVLMITTRCNLNSPFCNLRGRLNQPEQGRLTTDEWKKVIDSIPRRALVSIEGGEPFLAPGIFDVLDHLFERKQWVSIVTNGTALPAERTAYLVDRKLAYLSVSLDGMPEFHDELRGRAGAFERAAGILKRVHQEKMASSSSWPITCVKTNITADNHGEILRLIDHAESELHVDQFYLGFLWDNPPQAGFDFVDDLGDPALSHGNTFSYPSGQREAIKEMIRVVLARPKSHMEVAFMQQMDNEGLLGFVDTPSAYGVPQCYRPWTQFTVHFDGRVTPCITYEVDNIRNLDYDVRRAFRHPRYREFLSYLDSKRPFLAPCEGCPARHVRRDA